MSFEKAWRKLSTPTSNLVPRACDPREGSGIIRCRKPGILAKTDLRIPYQRPIRFLPETDYPRDSRTFLPEDRRFGQRDWPTSFKPQRPKLYLPAPHYKGNFPFSRLATSFNHVKNQSPGHAKKVECSFISSIYIGQKMHRLGNYRESWVMFAPPARAKRLQWKMALRKSQAGAGK
jgi:hypothetical protein